MVNFNTAYRLLYKYLDTLSGSRFIQVVKQHDAAHPDFADFIESRRQEEKSTLRKAYFKDILMSYPEAERQLLFSVFLDQYEKTGGNPDDIRAIRTLLETRQEGA